MSPTPGLLYVTMQPEDSLPEAQFHDWYNNEHGPLRVRLPFCTNGFRYRATDLPSSGPSKELPEWLAIYDITDMALMETPTYLDLRGDGIKTKREKATMAQIKVGRQFFDLLSEAKADDFREIENLIPGPEATVLVARSVVLNSKPGAEEQYAKWFNEEHLPLLQKVAGWQRTRRYKTSYLEADGKTEILALHEYKVVNGLKSPEFSAATNTDWRTKVMSELVESQGRRTYHLYYTFGPAPRELGALNSELTKLWNSIDEKTFAYPASVSDGIPAVSSFVTTKDGVELPYNISGSGDPDAPVLILINSILVTYGIWDGFLKSLFSSADGKKYRVVRYNSRGRSSQFGKEKIDLDLLASDTIAILDALRVKKAAAVIGVSVGGATSLNVALNYPDRVGGFVACDFNCNSSPGNVKAWGERISLAESDESVSTSGAEREVGEALAEATVRRWFVPESYDKGLIEKEVERTKSMVKTNDLEGFAKSICALYEYDLRPKMKECALPGLLVVGSGDGVLPAAMEKMIPGLKGEAGLKVIDGAGHLPMVEKPTEFCEAVETFL